jgi:predicted RNA-binding Zn-ribbon protein involved in translation (DUF1610 family)
MPLVAAKCTECGATVKVDAEKKTTVCESCGNAFIIEDAINNFNTQYFTTNEIQADTVNITNVSSDGTDIEPLGKRAKMYLEDGNWGQAYEYYDKILDINPEYAPAYVGKLCVKYRLKNENTLGGRMESMIGVADYEKALRFGDDLLRARLKGYEAEIQKRLELFAELSSREYRMGEYFWMVIHIQGGKVLMITKDCVAEKPYNSKSYTAVTWETCTLRKWLNGEFLNGFSDTERANIMEIDVINTDNIDNSGYINAKGGNNTKDKIFLLSSAAVKKYFPDNQSLIAANSGLVWLRSPGHTQSHAMVISEEGHIYDRYVHEWGYVRPVLCLDLRSEILSRDAKWENRRSEEILLERQKEKDELTKILHLDVIEIDDISAKVRFGKYIWRVLAVERTKALLITDKIIYKVMMPFERKYDAIREMLNRDFATEFSSEELSMIETTASDTMNEKVFLLSTDEVEKYFANEQSRIAKYDNKEEEWFLRTITFTPSSLGTGTLIPYVWHVKCDGKTGVTRILSPLSTDIRPAICGIRPAIWLDIEAMEKIQYVSPQGGAQDVVDFFDLKAARESQGRCRYCGGQLGIFHKCKSCGQKN